MNDLYLIILFCFLLGLGVIGFIYLYNGLLTVQWTNSELTTLITRTFREYYKGEDMEPVVVNNGIDIVWTGSVPNDVFNEENKHGFITIMIDGGANGLNSPLETVKEADILAGKIIDVVNSFVKDKEEV